MLSGEDLMQRQSTARAGVGFSILFFLSINPYHKSSVSEKPYILYSSYKKEAWRSTMLLFHCSS